MPDTVPHLRASLRNVLPANDELPTPVLDRAVVSLLQGVRDLANTDRGREAMDSLIEEFQAEAGYLVEDESHDSPRLPLMIGKALPPGIYRKADFPPLATLPIPWTQQDVDG